MSARTGAGRRNEITAPTQAEGTRRRARKRKKASHGGPDEASFASESVAQQCDRSFLAKAGAAVLDLDHTALAVSALLFRAPFEGGERRLVSNDAFEIFGGEIAFDTLTQIPAVKCDAPPQRFGRIVTHGVLFPSWDRRRVFGKLLIFSRLRFWP